MKLLIRVDLYNICGDEDSSTCIKFCKEFYDHFGGNPEFDEIEDIIETKGLDACLRFLKDWVESKKSRLFDLVREDVVFIDLYHSEDLELGRRELGFLFNVDQESMEVYKSSLSIQRL